MAATLYKVLLDSTDEGCGEVVVVLHIPRVRQILKGALCQAFLEAKKLEEARCSIFVNIFQYQYPAVVLRGTGSLFGIISQLRKTTCLAAGSKSKVVRMDWHVQTSGSLPHRCVVFVVVVQVVAVVVLEIK